MRQKIAPMGSTLENLRQEIQQLQVQNNNGQTFVDIPTFRTGLTKVRINDALRLCGFQLPSITYINCIQNKAYRLFALLLHLEATHLIGHFLDRKIEDLEVQKDRLSEVLRDYRESAHDPDYAYTLDEDFESKFLTNQWAFMADSFKRGDFSVYTSTTVLPIVKKKRLEEKDGSFGAIAEIVIAPSFDELGLEKTDEAEQWLIRKRIRRRQDGRDDFKKERDCLALLSEIRNPNIVPLLCSYSFNDQRYLIFPRAEMDLGEFLRRKERFARFVDDTTFFTALQGLASALDAVHNLTLTDRFDGSTFSRIGYHHDIRPANILVTTETFLLADFGLSKFKDPLQENSETEWKCGKGDYIAPECYAQEGFTHDRGGRAIDVWALGCMVVDIATYMEDGLDGLKAFRASRHSVFRPRVKNGYFFHDDHLKEVVSSHIENLQARPGNNALAYLVAAATTMLNMSPDERSKSSEIYNAFRFACTIALFMDCKKTICEFIVSAGDCGAVHFLSFVKFELVRLVSWGEILQLSTGRAELSAFATIEASKGGKELDSVTQIQEILLQLKETFHEWSAYVDDLDDATAANRIVEMENDLRRNTAARLDDLFGFIPINLRKEADRRAQQQIHIDITSKAPSSTYLEKKTRTAPTTSKSELDVALPLQRTGGCESLPAYSGPRWYVWDEETRNARPTPLLPRRTQHSHSEGADRQSIPGSILECIGFDPQRSVKALNPETTLEDILQLEGKFRFA